MEASIPMMRMTTSSSMRVKPPSLSRGSDSSRSRRAQLDHASLFGSAMAAPTLLHSHSYTRPNELTKVLTQAQTTRMAHQLQRLGVELQHYGPVNPEPEDQDSGSAKPQPGGQPGVPPPPPPPLPDPSSPPPGEDWDFTHRTQAQEPELPGTEAEEEPPSSHIKLLVGILIAVIFVGVLALAVPKLFGGGAPAENPGGLVPPDDPDDDGNQEEDPADIDPDDGQPTSTPGEPAPGTTGQS